nr:odorant binding protein 2 [Apocheima cinerarius]
MCNSRPQPPEKMPLLSRIVKIIIFLIFVSAFYLVVSFKPLTKDEQIEGFEKMNEYVEPFRRNLTECARQVKASQEDVQNFLKRIPQSTMQGKCFVACMLKRNAIITKNEINRDNLLEANKAVYGEDSEVWTRLQKAVTECAIVVDNIFEICEYASIFNDCMHMKMEHILDKATMERRMEALGQMTGDSDYWGEDEDEMLKLVKDEL